ncbi:hypothetical protein M422DRAFT_24076 [Sphaerobolus stellatus SS14]|nr:hypothetical protein M422DRAFT_24076 [Sphaerobolus stellatus SS14]
MRNLSSFLHQVSGKSQPLNEVKSTSSSSGLSAAPTAISGDSSDARASDVISFHYPAISRSDIMDFPNIYYAFRVIRQLGKLTHIDIYKCSGGINSSTLLVLSRRIMNMKVEEKGGNALVQES